MKIYGWVFVDVYVGTDFVFIGTDFVCIVL